LGSHEIYIFLINKDSRNQSFQLFSRSKVINKHLHMDSCADGKTPVRITRRPFTISGKICIFADSIAITKGDIPVCNRLETYGTNDPTTVMPTV
jgi:hypothetical protein